MARKRNLSADQLDRLNQRFERERAALLALGEARARVQNAEDELAAAHDALGVARREEREAYKAVVKLVGATAASELAGTLPTASKRRPPRTDGRQPPADDQRATSQLGRD